MRSTQIKNSKTTSIIYFYFYLFICTSLHLFSVKIIQFKVVPQAQIPSSARAESDTFLIPGYPLCSISIMVLIADTVDCDITINAITTTTTTAAAAAAALR